MADATSNTLTTITPQQFTAGVQEIVDAVNAGNAAIATQLSAIEATNQKMLLALESIAATLEPGAKKIGIEFERKT